MVFNSEDMASLNENWNKIWPRRQWRLARKRTKPMWEHNKSNFSQNASVSIGRAATSAATRPPGFRPQESRCLSGRTSSCDGWDCGRAARRKERQGPASCLHLGQSTRPLASHGTEPRTAGHFQRCRRNIPTVLTRTDWGNYLDCFNSWRNRHEWVFEWKLSSFDNYEETEVLLSVTYLTLRLFTPVK